MKSMHVFPILILLAGQAMAQADGTAGNWIHQMAFGMDCEPCAVGIERSVGKLPGVARVKVDLQTGLVDIGLEDSAEPSLATIRQAIVESGFTPREARVRLTGQIVERGDGIALTMGNERFALQPGKPVTSSTLDSHIGHTRTVEGTIDTEQHQQITVEAIDPVPTS